MFFFFFYVVLVVAEVSNTLICLYACKVYSSGYCTFSVCVLRLGQRQPLCHLLLSTTGKNRDNFLLLSFSCLSNSHFSGWKDDEVHLVCRARRELNLVMISNDPLHQVNDLRLPLEICFCIS